MKRIFIVSSLSGEQKEVAVHLLWLKDVIAILAYQFEESLIYQLYTMAKEMHIVQMLLFSLFRDSTPS